MSVREQEQQKSSCSGRGLGIAAAAIGVGVGAALYYFFSKSPENPDSTGATTSGWTSELTTTFPSNSQEDSDDYTTISEHSTSDTSIYDDSIITINSSSESYTDYENISNSFETDSLDNSTEVPNVESRETIDYQSDITAPESDSDSEELEETNNYSVSYHVDTMSFDDSLMGSSADSDQNRDNGSYIEDNTFDEDLFEIETPQLSNSYPQESRDLGNGYDSETRIEWDVTESSSIIPQIGPVPSYLFRLRQLSTFLAQDYRTAPPTREEKQADTLREKVFRERTRTLEECSICFDVMLQDEELLTLPCTHGFHIRCIGPWLQEHRTCPNCRKQA